MITLKEWMELVDYRITEGSEYQWHSYGNHAHMLDSWNGDHDGHSFTVIFDTDTQVVYETQAHDYVNNRAYRLINPEFRTQHTDESVDRGVNIDQAWDDVNYVDLDVDDDFIQKGLAIRAGEDYDTRVQIEVNFDDAELLEYMKLAHDRDITFNQLVEMALREAISAHEAGELTADDAVDWLHENVTQWPVEDQPKKSKKKKKDR